MGRQMQIALDATDFIALLNEISDWNFRAWKHRTEIPEPLHAPVSEFDGPYRQILLTFPDSRITLNSENRIDESDHIEIDLSYFDNAEKEPYNREAGIMPCLFYERIYLNTYRMHYTEELRTMQYYDEDEYHLGILKARYEAMCRIIKRKAVAIIKYGHVGWNVYIWPHIYEQMRLRHIFGIAGGGPAYEIKEPDIRLKKGIQPLHMPNSTKEN